MAVPLTLKVFKGEELIATKEYDRDIIKIGRLSSAHLCLEDEKVSRIHSVIEVAPDGTLSIIDMGSVEGTFVNGKRVNKGPVKFGDEIRLGGTTLKLEAGAGLQAAAQASVESEPTTQLTEAPAELLAQAAKAAPAPEPVRTPAPMPAQAAPEPVAAAPAAAPVKAPAAAKAMDPSFARTERHAVPAAAPAARVAKAPARPAPRRSKGGPLGLEVRFNWGDQRVGEYFLRPEKALAFTVGSAAGVNFVMGDQKLGGPKFDVVRHDGTSFVLRFTGKMNGELERNGSPMGLKQIIESGKASHDGDAYSITLDEDDYAWIDLGGVTLEVFFQSEPKAAFAPLLETVDFTMLNIFLVMFFIGAFFVVKAYNKDLEGDEFDDNLSDSQARIAKLIIKPPEIQKNPLLEKLAQQKKSQGEMAAKHRGEEGQMGKKDAPKRNAHAAPKGDPNIKDQARMMTQRIFGKGGGGISTVFGPNGLGGQLKSAMGNMFGAAPGDAHGLGGLGLRGSGSGGGGVGDTIGIGGIGTKGRGGGVGSYGTGIGTLSGKTGVDIGITSSEPTVQGSLDKELIRAVIRRNINQIRYCYESQLQRFPKLSGKVQVKFVISATGSVASSQVASTTTSNDELDTCVAGRVRTWLFPKPKGGGIVLVTYPFVFKPTGN